ncbi:LysR family transcriptional regulator [Glutamicibacter protophormiae]|uniref:LysR family transcriptional regulator n=1 Tax=Glutamicibacter protophormiae TaxID=37930 RepID=UPI003A94552B
MELAQLRYFLAVADDASFTRAAARLHVAQPGVSAQIRKLERELGQPLFDRSSRTIQLTELGRRIYPHAQAAVSAVFDVQRTGESLSGTLKGQVRIGMPISYHFAVLPELLTRFHTAHPAVEILLSESDSSDLVIDLVEGKLDLALISTNRAPAQIELRLVDDDPLVAAVSKSSRLATSGSISVARLAKHKLIAPPKGTGIRELIDDAFEPLGIAPHITLETRDLRVLAQLAGGGMGIALLPESVANAYTDSLHTLAVYGPAMRARVSLAWLRAGTKSAAAHAVVAFAHAAVPASALGTTPLSPKDNTTRAQTAL